MLNLKRIRWIIVGFLAALLIVGLIAIRSVPSKGARKQFEAIRAARLPASPVELNAWYKAVPEADNQALLIIEAGNLQVLPKKEMDPHSGRLGSLDAGEKLSPEFIDAIKDHLESNQPTVELLHRAAEVNESRYPIDLSLGVNTLLPAVAKVKSLVQLLRVDAAYQSHLGRPDLAVRSLNTSFAVAASLRNEPLLISDLVRIACVAITLKSLERVLSDHQLTDEQLVALSQKTAEAEAQGSESLFRAMVGERALGTSVFQMSFRDVDQIAMPQQPGTGIGPLQHIAFMAYRASGMHQRDLVIYLEIMEDFVRNSKAELPAALRNADHIEEEMFARSFRGLGRWAILSRMLVPALKNATEKHANSTALLRYAQIALAIERFRLEHDGRLPETLEQLTPKYIFKVPLDPFNGSPFIYQRGEWKGYTLTTTEASRQKMGVSKNAPENSFKVLR